MLKVDINKVKRSSEMKTSLIIPAYNEEKGVPLVIEEYSDKLDEIIVVDDGSTDRTFEWQ